MGGLSETTNHAGSMAGLNDRVNEAQGIFVRDFGFRSRLRWTGSRG